MAHHPFKRSYRLTYYANVVLFIGVAVLFAVLMAYVFAFLVGVGLVLYAVYFIRQRFFPQPVPPHQTQSQGRLIEHEDL